MGRFEIPLDSAGRKTDGPVLPTSYGAQRIFLVDVLDIGVKSLAQCNGFVRRAVVLAEPRTHIGEIHIVVLLPNASESRCEFLGIIRRQDRRYPSIEIEQIEQGVTGKFVRDLSQRDLCLVDIALLEPGHDGCVIGVVAEKLCIAPLLFEEGFCVRRKLRLVLFAVERAANDTIGRPAVARLWDQLERFRVLAYKREISG